MNHRLLIVTLLAFLSFRSFGQTSPGNYKSGFSKKGNTFSFTTTNSEVRLEFCKADMFRVRSSDSKPFEADESLMVVKYNWDDVPFTSTEGKDYFTLSSSQLTVKVYKMPFSIDVFNKEGKLISSEKINGKAAGMGKHGDSVYCTKQLQPNEHFFGFGERMDFIDQRSKKLNLNVGRGKGLPHVVGAYNVNEANYCPVPFFMSTEGYGIFLHNAFATTWDMGFSDTKQYSFGAADGELDYYFFYGPTLPHILDNYTTLTGKAPLMPQFALGLHVGTYAGGTWSYEQYSSDKYVVELARKLRAMGIPADLLWIDSVWRIFGEVGGKGATSFEWRPTFKDPKAMFDSIYAMDYKMVGLHLRPRFDNGTKLKLLDTAQMFGYTYPEEKSAGEFVNFFDPQAVDWWWHHGVMNVAKLGAKFLKTDEGSAFGALANESDKVGPQGRDVNKLHNVFPIAYAKAPYEKFQQLNKMRGLNQTREGYAGIQRYPFIFAGDWPSEWQYFAPVIKAGINIGLSGVGNWAHCMGGFEHVADPELYARWVQFGMFSPVALVFGMEHPTYKEPWAYGDTALKIFKQYDSLRYRLIPYIYSNAYNMYKTGMPLMRSLVLDYQDDENVYNITDQYLFGSSMMVCPVTTKGAQTRTVYLPKGNWVNYFTGKTYTGHQYVHVVTPLDTMPIFIKEGSIIPMQPAMKYFGEKPVDVITLDIYPAANASFNLYEDDGISLDYQQNKFAITTINTSLTSKGLQVNIKKPEGTFKPSTHTYLAKIHTDKTPSSIKENGIMLSLVGKETIDKNSGWFYNATTKTLWIKTATSNDKDIIIVVE